MTVLLGLQRGKFDPSCKLEGLHGKPISLHKRILQILKDLAVHLKYIRRTECKVTAGKGHYPENSKK